MLAVMGARSPLCAPPRLVGAPRVAISNARTADHLVVSRTGVVKEQHRKGAVRAVLRLFDSRVNTASA